MKSSIKRMSAQDLKAALHDEGEVAVLDAREEATFHDKHLLFAACAPLGRLEVLVADMVPRRSVRTVWCDAGDGAGSAARAAEAMAALGYTDVSVLEGGVAQWEAAGYPVYSGVHVPSKAFAEVVEHEAGTPYVTAEALKALIDDGADIAILDTRSYEEFHGNSIPGAVSAPGAELLLRFKELAPSPDTLVIVNCGGRTRSIIGAQALINAGVENRVVSLMNGTQDWHLAGYEVQSGSTARAPEPSAASRALARAGADRIAKMSDVREIDAATLADWRAEGDRRTLYLIDVRTAEEYLAGHAPGARHVAGGQLVQETDRHMAVWGARVVLFDDDGVRATLTASWLKQMGWDASIMRNDAVAGDLSSGPYAPQVLGLEACAPPMISPSDLQQALMDDGTAVVDLDLSRTYREGHIPSAWFALRGRLQDDLSKVGPAERLVFTCRDGVLAKLAAAEHADAAPEVTALAGGTTAWAAAGLPLEQGAERMASAPDDIRLRAREMGADVEAAMRAYLAWEIELVNQMAVDDDHRFQVATP